MLTSQKIAQVLKKAGFLPAKTSATAIRGWRDCSQAGFQAHRPRAWALPEGTVAVEYHDRWPNPHRNAEEQLKAYHDTLTDAGYHSTIVGRSYLLVRELEKGE